MNRKKWLILALVIVVAVGAIVLWLYQREVRLDMEIKSGDFLAQGSIPASAKLFPIVDETTQMTVIDGDGLSKEDIWTITHYVDLFASLDNTLSENYDPSGMTFLTTTTPDKIESTNKENQNQYYVNGVQILSIYAESDSRVEAIYLSRLDGSSNELPSGSYDVIASLFFKKVNGNWYEDGIGHYITGPTGSFNYTKDPITGQLSVTPTV